MSPAHTALMSSLLTLDFEGHKTGPKERNICFHATVEFPQKCGVSHLGDLKEARGESIWTAHLLEGLSHKQTLPFI